MRANYEVQVEYKEDTKYFRCLGRNKLVKAKPEEEVRQNLLMYLLNEINIPKSMLCVEEPISKYGIENNNGRADIIVDHETETERYPLILVECKKPTVLLTYKVREQLERYNDELRSPIVGMSNGEVMDWFVLNEITGEYEQVINLPSYQECIKHQGFQYIVPNNFESFNENDEKYHEVPIIMRSFIVNFDNMIYNYSEDVPLFEGKGFRVVKDEGTRLESNGNAGGGSWDLEYRCLLMNYGQKYNHTMSFALSIDETCYLAVSVDDTTTNHNSLQLNLYDWVRIVGSTIQIWHDGTITVGRLGRAKNEDVISFVKNIYPEIVVGDKIFLGELDNSVQFSFQNKDIKSLMLNLIKYIICREKFRVKFKQ